MQVAETFAFPIPVDQLPQETQARLIQLMPSEEQRASWCPTGNCPVHKASTAGSTGSGNSEDTQVGDVVYCMVCPNIIVCSAR
jgi:hypothetical protein